MPYSLRAYAKHRVARGLAGSPMAVSLAIRDGRLRDCVARVPPNDDPKITDFAKADEEWDRNTNSQKRANAAGGVDPNTAPISVTATPRLIAAASAGEVRVLAAALEEDTESIATATERLKSAQADLAELKRDEHRGVLVLAKDVERRLVAVFSACKTRLLAIPSRARQALPQLAHADVLVIEGLVREALEELAEAEPAP